MISAVPNISVPCRARPCKDLGTKILVPRSWYQDLRAREAEPLGMQGGTGGCRPLATGSGGLEAPQEQQGVWGRQPSSENNFMDPEPEFWDQDLIFFVQKI